MWDGTSGSMVAGVPPCDPGAADCVGEGRFPEPGQFNQESSELWVLLVFLLAKQRIECSAKSGEVLQ